MPPPNGIAVITDMSAIPTPMAAHPPPRLLKEANANGPSSGAEETRDATPKSPRVPVLYDECIRRVRRPVRADGSRAIYRACAHQGRQSEPGRQGTDAPRAYHDAAWKSALS